MRFPLLLIALAVAPLGAQSTVRTTTDLRASPGGQVIATLRPGATVRTSGVRGRYTHVVLEGYVASHVMGRGRSAGSIRVPAGDRVILRAGASPGATPAATLRSGTSLIALSRRGGWLRARREGWVLTSALRRSAPPPGRVAASPRSPTRAAAPPARRASGGEVATADRPAPSVLTAPRTVIDTVVAPSRATSLRASPEGRSLASLAPGVSMTPLARERGWMRVRVEGWVQERDLIPVDTALRSGLTAADLKADPEGTKGKIVRWSVQVLALQTADPLRKDLAPDETYLLARGPDEENALLYLAVPPSLLDDVRTIPALTPVIISARVRVGRSQPVGVPILDLRSITRR